MLHLEVGQIQCRLFFCICELDMHLTVRIACNFLTPENSMLQVAKDRAVEGLVLTGSKFVLNILGQGKSGPVSKQLLKSFKPGESRLEGLQTKETESDSHILLDAVRLLHNIWH